MPQKKGSVFTPVQVSSAGCVIPGRWVPRLGSVAKSQAELSPITNDATALGFDLTALGVEDEDDGRDTPVTQSGLPPAGESDELDRTALKAEDPAPVPGTLDGPLVGLTSVSTSVQPVFATPATAIPPHGPAEPARAREDASDPKDTTSDESQPSHLAIMQSEVAPSQEF
ncbi:hypothetical protein PtA15_17A97 [Puccinia triticina]|uniref:Uncharacterized protein n=1 Tax=Puccinia triticina TaxID=208348 RepID=A0ABY7D9C6_9BASI|nr:uncharacterized protein PtA15_17A97 [Puccinia triticina]WAQ92615.1 hypothetical protein PtA15_17A97 [Puccinia triticina]WAR63495.1 hypothetical protein PtB15_17B95 [Puccinia triticina]